MVHAETTIVANGSCGNNVTWGFDDTGKLTISGNGAIADYNQIGSRAPWYEYRTSINNVVIENGVTSIGKAFAKDLKTIYNASTEEEGRKALDKVTEKWEEKYPRAMKRWYETC